MKHIITAGVIFTFFLFSEKNVFPVASAPFLFLEGQVTVNVFPNPFTDKVQFQVEGIQEGQIQVYNMMGEKLKSYDLEANKIKYTFDLSDLPQGFYFYKIVHKGQVLETKRIIKRH